MSFAEENYLKAIYHLSRGGKSPVTTNAIAGRMNTRAASVTDMIKKLSGKGLLSYKRYNGVNISDEGRTRALQVIRKHRLWETFLVEKLHFNWDEVHEVAEQLEHIKSHLLISRLDEFLGHPKTDPHGDPIPDEHGEIKAKPKLQLSQTHEGQAGTIVNVKDSSSSFLKYLDKIGAYIGARVQVLERLEFDESLEIKIDNNKQVFISKEVADNIWITE